MDSLYTLILVIMSVAQIAPGPWDIQNAEALISGDPKTQTQPSRPDEAPRAKVALAIVGKRLDYGHPSEYYYRDYDASIKWLRECRTELESTPPSYDLDRFPSRDVAQAHLKFTTTFVTHFTERYSMYLDHQQDFQAICREIGLRREAWNLLDTAHLSPTLWNRRRTLSRLQALIGPENYALGVIPFPIPDEAFAPYPNWGGSP